MGLELFRQYEQISQEIFYFFRFTNLTNDHVVLKTEKDEEQRTQTHRIFSRCVTCYEEKFSREDWINIKLNSNNLLRGTDTYFCKS